MWRSDPRLCDPPEFELDISKRSPTPDPSSYAGISATTLASARSVEPEPDTEPADYGNGLGRRGDGIIKSKRGWVPDRDGLVKDESKKLKSKRALEPLSPDRWGVVDSRTGVNNGAVKRADRTTVVVNSGKRAVDGEAEREAHTGIGSGIVIGSKEKRDAKALEGVGGGGGGAPLDTVSDTEEEGDVVGNGIVIGSKDKREANEGTVVGNGIVIGSKDKREALEGSFGGGGGTPPAIVGDTEEEGDIVGNGIVIGSKLNLKREADGGIVSSGSSHPPRRTDDDEESGGIVDNGIVIGSKLKLKLKRDGAEKPHWGVGNGNAVQKRSIIGVGNFLDGAVDSEVQNGAIVILLGEAGNEKRSDVSESYQVRDGATVVFSNPEENEKRSDGSGSDQVSSGTLIVFSNPEENEKRSDISESVQVSSGATVVFSNLEENEKRSDVSGSNQVSSGSNTVLVNPEGNAKRSGVSVGNQVE